MSVKKIIAIALATGISFAQGNAQLKNQPHMKSFSIEFPGQGIKDLQQRIRNTRWFDEAPQPGSISIGELKEIAGHWLNKYNWQAEQDWLNSFRHYTATVNNATIHFIYEKGTGPEHIPLLLLHGWAGSFVQYLRLAELLKKSNPEFDLIIPSMPGFGYSAAPEGPLNSAAAAASVHQLMTVVLGYKTWFAHGSDFGAFVGEQLALKYPSALKGLHLTDIPYYHLYSNNENLTEAENEFIQKINNWSMQDGAYAGIQGTRPKILSVGLNDSPMALAAWLLQLYQDFSDKEKPLEAKYNLDDLLTNFNIYWFTGTVYSSMRIYSEEDLGFGAPVTEKVSLPTGFSFFPYDIAGDVPEVFVKRFFSNVISWSKPATGGHFSSMEKPEEMRKEITGFIEKAGK